MKAYVKHPLLIIFLSLSLIWFSQAKQDNHNKSVPTQVTNKVFSASPIRLSIPTINVDAEIQNVGINKAGEMDVPSNTIDVGWFMLGPRPGEKGSAVISGHFDSKNGETAVFANLHKLKIGDKLYIKDDKGGKITFIVSEKRIYDPGYADEVFSRNDSAHLNLITCDGVWEGDKKSYSKRLVIFSDLVD